MKWCASIAVLCSEESVRDELTDKLVRAGFAGVQGVNKLAELRPEAPPAIVVTAGSRAIEWTRAVARSPMGGAAVLILLPRSDDRSARSAVEAGARDVLEYPAQEALLAVRLRLLISCWQASRDAYELRSANQALLDIHTIMAGQGDALEVLSAALVVARDLLGFDRAAILAHAQDSDRGHVIAATDSSAGSILDIVLWEYPEVLAVMESGEPVQIDDSQEHPITSAVRAKLGEKQVRAILVVPVRWRGRVLGSLIFRSSIPGIALSEAQRSFANFFAIRIAALVRDSRIAERLNEKTQQITRASYEVERQLRTAEPLKEHFDAAADGIFVLDAKGQIVFVNRVAETITGFPRSSLVGLPLADLLVADAEAVLFEVIKRVIGGQNIEAFDLDLDLDTTRGQPVCVSITTSTVLARSAAVVLSFREVTAERALEAELRKTKDFLERLIDSTVDGIIASDTKGRVILYNQGAQRIVGYSPAEVIGRLSIETLYPSGVVQDIMRQLRAEAFGGRGRLEKTRRELVDQQGTRVPVSMSASIVYEKDEEVAMVGIFADLRERLRIEEQLHRTEERLELSEKRALVAQLAGAAAHELNQPLTSIMGYAELLCRKLKADDSRLRSAEILVGETERMAEIVRKIGRITNFETKDYVGSASIIDLDRSSASRKDDDTQPMARMPLCPRRSDVATSPLESEHERDETNPDNFNDDDKNGTRNIGG